MNEQQALMAAILTAEPALQRELHGLKVEQQGLAIYKRNLHANAVRALAISFPTVEKLLGDALFAHSAEQLLLIAPPSLGDWGLWGAEFSKVLAQLPALQDYPYVADMAELDYALHLLSRAKDSVVDLDSMALLGQYDIDDLNIVLNPVIRMMESEYPIFDIYQANNVTDESSGISAIKCLNNAKLKMAAGLGQQVLLYRPQFKARVREQDKAEQHWLHLLNAGKSIGESLERIDQTFKHVRDPFLFEQWLPRAVDENTIIGIERRV